MSSDDLVFQRRRSAYRDFRNHEQGGNSFSIETGHKQQRHRRSDFQCMTKCRLDKQPTEVVTAIDRIRMKIGFIGLGIMGSRMAANLQKHGYALVVFNRTRDK